MCARRKLVARFNKENTFYFSLVTKSLLYERDRSHEGIYVTIKGNRCIIQKSYFCKAHFLLRPLILTQFSFSITRCKLHLVHFFLIYSAYRTNINHKVNKSFLVSYFLHCNQIVQVKVSTTVWKIFTCFLYILSDLAMITAEFNIPKNVSALHFISYKFR
jgi:hypothetical protein